MNFSDETKRKLADIVEPYAVQWCDMHAHEAAVDAALSTLTLADLMQVERPECCKELYGNPSGPWRNEELPEGFRVQNRIFAADDAGAAICTITCRSFIEADYYAKLIIAADRIGKQQP